MTLPLTATEVIEPRSRDWFEMDDGEVVDMWMGQELGAAVRRLAEEVTGGNCAFADDDLRILAHLAKRAVEAGLTDGLSPNIRAKITRKAEQNQLPRITEKW